jgi:nicotinamidase-related amidase
MVSEEIMARLRSLPLPPRFDPGGADRVLRVPYLERAREAQDWARLHALRPASEDTRRVGLLLVDVQNTFCLPEFELYVAGRSGRGAVEDSGRIAAFVYRNLGSITRITATLDTHSALQIFHPVFWVDASGEPPPPYTLVTATDVESGVWRVNPRLAAALAPRAGFDMDAYARHYTTRLAAGGKYPLTIWPYHAMLGGIGHALVGIVEEALFFHSVARSAPTRFEVKGNHPLTEHYSVLRPEVTEDHEGRPLTPETRALVDALLELDVIVVAGQAKSHCVAWTLEDLLTRIRERDPALARKVYLLEDCASPVVVPGVVDYTDAADAAYRRFAEAGVRLVRSTDPLESWPGLG